MTNQKHHDSIGTLSRKQQRALSALAAQPTIALAASATGVTARTLYRWLNEDAAFQAEYRAMGRELINNATYQLVKASNNAVHCLISVMNDGEAPPAARVGAAKIVLEMAFRGIEVSDLQARIKALEGLLANRSNGHH